jgi:purine-binding chemotaxis protein CheW
VTGVVVRLRVGREEYALPVENVREVAELGELAPLPGTPPVVLGVRNLRGQILPVYDLAAVLGVVGDGTPRRLVVAENDGRQAGLAIDEVSDVDVLPDPTGETDSPLLRGSTLAGEGLVGIVDVPALFGALERQGTR